MSAKLNNRSTVMWPDGKGMTVTRLNASERREFDSLGRRWACRQRLTPSQFDRYMALRQRYENTPQGPAP